jgi:hypothetical protein
MVIYIANVFNEYGGSDVSLYLDRQGSFSIAAEIGQRMDTLEATFFDPARILTVPDRAEIIIYDANVDPRWRKPNPNMLTDATANLEASLGAWVAASNATVTRSPAWSAQGTQSLAVTSVAAGNMTARSGSTIAAYATVTPGAAYTLIATERSAALPRTIRVNIDWLDSTGALLSTTTGANVTSSTTVNALLQTNGTAPAGASYARAVLAVDSTAAANETHYWDMLMLAPALPANAAPLWQISNYPLVDPPPNPPFGPPALWTPRLFGGYCSSASYVVTAGTQRVLTVHAQDYTIRNKTTICNKAYGVDGTHANGWTDDQIIKDLYATYRPDIDTSNVQSAFAIPGTTMPTISFPTHSLEQMLTRVQKISLGWYRDDYYKRLFYGGVGVGPGSLAPFAINNDAPSSTIPANLLSKDASDFEASIGTWATRQYNGINYAGRVFQTSAIAKSGAASLQFVGTTDTAAGGAIGFAEIATSQLYGSGAFPSGLIGNLVSVVPGSIYSATIASRAATTGRLWKLSFFWLDATGTYLSNDGGPLSLTSSSVWTQLAHTATAPANAAYLMLDVNTSNGGFGTGPIPIGESHYFDEAQILSGALTVTPPTIVSYADTVWNTGASSKTLTISWLAGDVIVYAAGSDANDTLPIPTAAGLTFTSQRSNNAGSTSSAQLAIAIAPAAGTSVVLTGTDTSSSTNHWGFAVWVIRGAIGFGASAEQHTATQTVPLGPTGPHSSIVWIGFDFTGSAVAGVSATPTPTNIRRALSDPTLYTIYAQDLADQASASSVPYGTSGGGTGPWSILAQELPGTPTIPTWAAGGVPSYGSEAMTYAPDWSTLFNRIWVIGGQMTGNVTPAQPLTPAAGTYSGQQVFGLPAQVNNIQDATTVVTITAPGPVVTTYTGGVYISGVIQIGSLGKDGTLDNLAASNSPVLIGSTSPFTLALKTAPPTGSQVTISAKFRYPLTLIYTDPTMLNSLGGNVFEKVLRDKRIVDLTLAKQVAQQNVAAEGSTKKGGQFVVDQRGVGGNLLQPGQYIRITNSALFTGLLPGGATSGAFLVTGITTALSEDTVSPYLLTVSYSDRQESTDDDIIDLAIGEQGRVNSALDAGDVYDTIQDLQTIIDTIGAGTETITVTHTSPHPALYDAASSLWGDTSYS